MEATQPTGKEMGKQKLGNQHVNGRPGQPEESKKNAKGTLRYETETETCWYTRCEKYATSDERGAAAHIATHTSEGQKRRLQREQQPIQKNPQQNADGIRICTLGQYRTKQR